AYPFFGFGPAGTVFKLNKDGSAYSILRSFPLEATGGQHPEASLVEGSDGAMYGTTLSGGSDEGAGTVFKLNKDGGDYAILWNFSATGHDGQNPGDLIESSTGTLFGITGGSVGTVYQVNKDGTEHTVLTEHF